MSALLGALAGLGKGMTDYAGILGEKRKNDWASEAANVKHQRETELEMLRSKNTLERDKILSDYKKDEISHTGATNVATAVGTTRGNLEVQADFTLGEKGRAARSVLAEEDAIKLDEEFARKVKGLHIAGDIESGQINQRGRIEGSLQQARLDAASTESALDRSSRSEENKLNRSLTESEGQKNRSQAIKLSDKEIQGRKDLQGMQGEQAERLQNQRAKHAQAQAENDLYLRLAEDMYGVETKKQLITYQNQEALKLAQEQAQVAEKMKHQEKVNYLDRFMDSQAYAEMTVDQQQALELAILFPEVYSLMVDPRENAEVTKEKVKLFTEIFNAPPKVYDDLNADERKRFQAIKNSNPNLADMPNSTAYSFYQASDIVDKKFPKTKSPFSKVSKEKILSQSQIQDMASDLRDKKFTEEELKAVTTPDLYKTIVEMSKSGEASSESGTTKSTESAEPDNKLEAEIAKIQSKSKWIARTEAERIARKNLGMDAEGKEKAKEEAISARAKEIKAKDKAVSDREARRQAMNQLGYK